MGPAVREVDGWQSAGGDCRRVSRRSDTGDHIGALAVFTTASAVPVQMRLATALTSEQYISQQAWRGASLPGCPLGHEPCRAVGHGSYGRKKPAGIRVARRRCKPCGVTIGLLPDFLASRVSGTLDELEQAAAVAERAPSQWKAAEQLRPHDGAFESAVKWVRFRIRIVAELLRCAVGLVPELLGCEPTLGAMRDQLGLDGGGVLRKLRGLCEPHLGSLAAPLGLVPRPHAADKRKRCRPQSTGPDPPREGE